jgi:thiamine monophosphate synthase
VVIGGIDLARAAEVVEAGASGIAVIAAVVHPSELEMRVRALLGALASAKSTRLRRG